MGPNGVETIEAFCAYANKNFQSKYCRFMALNIVPRFDKNLPEIEYEMNGKKLNRIQANKYLSRFEHDLDGLEEDLQEVLAHLIDDYLAAQ